MIGYKKVRVRNTYVYAILQLEIPKQARVICCTSNNVKRKQRATSAKVIRVVQYQDLFGVKIKFRFRSERHVFVSMYKQRFHYAVGKTVRARNFTYNEGEICGGGIHFYDYLQGAIQH